jgi:hypothetical protein
LVLALTGCRGQIPVSEVEGTVRAGGTPLANVVVEFLPDPEKGAAGPKSAGLTNEKGAFRLRCDDGRQGAVVGWHRVVVSDPNEERPAQGQPRRMAPRVAERFATAASTPLRKEVQEGKQTIDLEVSR